jgi:hypothetical protein
MTMSDDKTRYCRFKTAFCAFKNECKNGDECEFVHFQEELEPVKCWFDYTSGCMKGKSCRYWNKTLENKLDYYKRIEQFNEDKKIKKINNKKFYKLNIENIQTNIETENKQIEDEKQIKEDIEILKKIKEIKNENKNINKEIKNDIDNIVIQNTIYQNESLNSNFKEETKEFYKQNEKYIELNEFQVIKVNKVFNKKLDFIEYYNKIEDNVIFIEQINNIYSLTISSNKKNLEKYFNDEENNLPF